MPLTQGTYVLGGSGGGSLSDISNRVSTAMGDVPSVPIGTNYGAVNITQQNVYPITGKMITAQKNISSNELEILSLSVYPQLYEDEIKKDLLMQLIEIIFTEKCVEFTKMQNLVENSVLYRARIYVTPDEQTRLLRQNKIGD